MVKYNSQIGEADPTYRGTVSYIPNRDRKKISIRLDWTTPVLETLVISNGQYRLYRPKIQQGYEGAVDKARSNSAAAGPLSFLGMTKEQLKANFSVRFIGTETVNAGRLATTKIELTPKQKADYKTAELWIDANGMPAQARIVATNNDLTTVLITNEKRNVKIDSKVFNYKFPKGTKIIKD